MTSSGIDHGSGFCNSIGGCISETDRLDTPVILGTNKNSRRPTSSWNSSSFLIHLIVSAPPSTSAEDKTHFAFLLQQLPYLLLSLSQRLFVNAFRPLSYSQAKVGGTVRQLGSISCVLLDPKSKHTDGLHRCQRDVLYFQSGAKERWICRWIRVCERTVAWHWGTWDWSCGFDNGEW